MGKELGGTVDFGFQCAMDWAFVRDLKQACSNGVIQRPPQNELNIDLVKFPFFRFAVLAILGVNTSVREPHRYLL